MLYFYVAKIFWRTGSCKRTNHGNENGPHLVTSPQSRAPTLRRTEAEPEAAPTAITHPGLARGALQARGRVPEVREEPVARRHHARVPSRPQGLHDPLPPLPAPLHASAHQLGPSLPGRAALLLPHADARPAPQLREQFSRRRQRPCSGHLPLGHLPLRQPEARLQQDRREVPLHRVQAPEVGEEGEALPRSRPRHHDRLHGRRHGTRDPQAAS